MKWPCITLIIAPPFSRWFFVHSNPLRGMRMVDCASWVCITPSMIVTPYRWMLVLMCGHKYFFAFYCHFLHRKLELVCQEPGRWDIKNEAWLYSAWTTPKFNASTKYSTYRLVFGKLEPRVSLNKWCGHWPGGREGRGGGGGGGIDQSWRSGLEDIWTPSVFFFFFFFFCCSASRSTCLKWDCLVSSMVSMIPMVNASWPWQFLFYPVYLLVACQVVFSRSRIDLPKHKLDEKHEKTYAMP